MAMKGQVRQKNRHGERFIVRKSWSQWQKIMQRSAVQPYSASIFNAICVTEQRLHSGGRTAWQRANGCVGRQLQFMFGAACAREDTLRQERSIDAEQWR
jgi:hypothetical protein